MQSRHSTRSPCSSTRQIFEGAMFGKLTARIASGVLSRSKDSAGSCRYTSARPEYTLWGSESPRAPPRDTTSKLASATPELTHRRMPPRANLRASFLVESVVTTVSSTQRVRFERGVLPRVELPPEIDGADQLHQLLPRQAGLGGVIRPRTACDAPVAESLPEGPGVARLVLERRHVQLLDEGAVP